MTSMDDRDWTVADVWPPSSAYGGVVIGTLAGIDEAGRPLVHYPSALESEPVVALATSRLAAEHIGGEVALLFDSNRRPIVIGPILERCTNETLLAVEPEQEDPSPRQAEEDETVTVERDGERLELTAQREIVLRCGTASITLTRAGKVLIRGKYLLSRSSGVNRIKGGSVQIN